MNNIVEHIYNGNFEAANQIIEEGMERKLRSALHASKKKLAAKKFTGEPVFRSMEEKVEKGDDTKEAEYDEKKAKQAQDMCEGELKISNRILKNMAMGNDKSEPNDADNEPDTEDDEKENGTLKKIVNQDANRSGDEPLSEARIAIVRARIRNGKVQRRKKVSLVPGMTMRGGKLTRMSAAERRKRKMGARRGKLKTRAKRVQMLRKRKLSLMKRKRLGI